MDVYRHTEIWKTWILLTHESNTKQWGLRMFSRTNTSFLNPIYLNTDHPYRWSPLSHWLPSSSVIVLFLLLHLSFLLDCTHKRKHSVLVFLNLVYFAYTNGLHFLANNILFLNILLILSEFPDNAF